MSILKPKRVMEVPDYKYGVCLWRLPDGGYIVDGYQNYLSCSGKVGDKVVEEKMRRAANSLGVETGKPFWLPGFRKVTQGEWEDQMAELQDGGIPDPVDVWRQSEYGN